MAGMSRSGRLVFPTSSSILVRERCGRLTFIPVPRLSQSGWRTSNLQCTAERRKPRQDLGNNYVQYCLQKNHWLGLTNQASVQPASSCGVLLISEGFIDGASSDAGEDGVGALVVGEGDQPDGQRPAATSRPRRVIDRERCAEDVPGLGGEEIPRDLQVAGRIAHAQTPEVDDGADPAIDEQQVPWREVSVNPDGQAGPCGSLQ